MDMLVRVLRVAELLAPYDNLPTKTGEPKPLYPPLRSKVKSGAGTNNTRIKK